ncbi:MAG: sensor histidine kinase [Pirellulales bacterium]
MLWLQLVHDRGAVGRWPVLPSTARAMADALLWTKRSRRATASGEAAVGVDLSASERSQLAARLSCDPLLALWCHTIAASGSPPCELSTAEDVCDWFAAAALEKLNVGHLLVDDESSTEIQQDVIAPASQAVERAAALAHLSAAVGRAADDQAAQNRRSSRLPDEAAHLARLYIGACWCHGSLPGATDKPSRQQQVGNVASQLAEYFGGWPTHVDRDRWAAAVACVKQALDRLSAADWIAPAEDIATASAVAHGQAVARQWSDSVNQQDGTVAENSLRALLTQLSELKKLKTTFAADLEREKLAALAEFAGGAGHEINNPLAVISGRAQLLLGSERDPQRRRELAVIAAQASRIHEMIADLMLFARPPSPRRAACDLGSLIEHVLKPFRAELRERDVQLIVSRPPRPIVIHADATQVAVAVAALVRNSCEAIVATGRIEVSVGWHVPQAAAPANTSLAEIVVADDGPGLPDDVRRHLYDPYFSGRPAGRGLGLGLSKCWRIAQQHGGRLEVDHRTEGGARFRLLLPVNEPADVALDEGLASV